MFVKSLKFKFLASSLLLGLLLFSSFSSSFKSFFNPQDIMIIPAEKEMNQRVESFLASNNMESLMQKANEKKELSLNNNNLNQGKNAFSIQTHKSYGPDVVDEVGDWQFGLTFHLPTERMARSSWSNFWFIDTVPLIIRKGILSTLGFGDPGNTSQWTRDFIMGKTSEFAKGNYGGKKQLHAVYWDRVIPWPVFVLLQVALGEIALNQIAKIWDGFKIWKSNLLSRNLGEIDANISYRKEEIMKYLEIAFVWLINNIKNFLPGFIITISYAVRWLGNMKLANDMRNYPDYYKDSILFQISSVWENIKNIPFIGEALGFLIDNDLFTYTGVPLY